MEDLIQINNKDIINSILSKLYPSYDFRSVTDLKVECLVYCMSKNDVPTSTIILQIRNLLFSLYQRIKNSMLMDEIKMIKEEEVITFEPNDEDVNITSLIDSYVETLTVLKCVVETPSYYTDKEDFDEKYNEILLTLAEFKDEAQMLASQQINYNIYSIYKSIEDEKSE